jgi:elongation factor Ts
MAEISAQMVKELREKTNAGMMDCKKALTAANGDMEAAVNWLREKGLSAAAKKAGRVAAEGLVGVMAEGHLAAMVEINCETDFVAKNPDFQQFVGAIAGTVLKSKPKDLDGLMAAPLDGKTVKDALNDKVSKIGENITIRRFALAEGNGLGTYIHMGGSIGVIVELSIGDASKADALKGVARDVAMQVAAGSPLFVRKEDADPKAIENEKSIAREKAKADGKPEKILDKIAEGAATKYVQENALLEQAFVKDDKLTIQKLLEKMGKEVGTTVGVKAMHRFKVGEGIEKKADDFAAEVAKMAGTP